MRPTTTNDAPAGAVDENGLLLFVPEAVRREFIEQLDADDAMYRAEMKRLLARDGMPTAPPETPDKK